MTQKSCAVGMRNAKPGNHLKSSYSFTREESFDYLIIIYVQFKFNSLFFFRLIDVLSANQFSEFLHAYYCAINRCFLVLHMRYASLLTESHVKYT